MQIPVPEIIGAPEGFEAPKSFNTNFMASFGQEGDPTHLVEFFYQKEYREFKSLQAGRPVEEDVEYVRIQKLGNKSFYVGRVEQRHRLAYPYQYAMFKKGGKDQTPGSPIAECTWISSNMMATLQILGVKTVEQLAAMSDVELEVLGIEGQSLRKQAQIQVKAKREYEQSLRGQSEFNRQQAEIDELKKLVQMQTEMLSKLQSTPIAVQEEEKPKRTKRAAEPQSGSDSDTKLY